MGLNTPESVVEFIMILGLFIWERLKESAARIAAGVNPWNAKTFVSGVTGTLYIVFGIALIIWIFVDGFGRHFKRNCVLLCVLFVLFVLSFLK